MSYVVTFYTKAVQPIQEFYETKKQALVVMSEEVKIAKVNIKILVISK